MGISFKYKGRSFSSTRAMMQVVQRDVADGIERNIRSAAIAAGAKAKKTAQGLEISGSASQLERFCRRLER